MLFYLQICTRLCPPAKSCTQLRVAVPACTGQCWAAPKLYLSWCIANTPRCAWLHHSPLAPHTKTRPVWPATSGKKNMARIGNQSICANSQPGGEAEEKNGHSPNTRWCNGHTQQSPHSVCQCAVRCHAATHCGFQCFPRCFPTRS